MSLHPFPRRRASLRILAGGMALALCSPSVAAFAQAAAPAASMSAASPLAGIKSLLIFPFANNAGDGGAAIAAKVNDAVKIRINTIGNLKATSYSTFLPSVERALDDNTISKDDVAGPFTDTGKAGRIATQVDTDGFLTGAVETYTADPSAKKVTLEVTATVYNTATGASLETLAFTGSGVASSAADDMNTVSQSAINDVASKIVSRLNQGAPMMAPMVSPSTGRGKHHVGETALLVALSAGLIYAVFHNAGGGGNNSSSGSSTTGTTGTVAGAGGPPAPPK